ncbi:MAG: hypothetical protein LAT84_03390 [Balneolia bacterium]|nr:hypothetical protein [Balneolia bacterium]
MSGHKQLFLLLAISSFFAGPDSAFSFSSQAQHEPGHVIEEVDLLSTFFQFHYRNNNTGQVEATYDRLEKLSNGNPLSYAGLHLQLLEAEAHGVNERYAESTAILEELIDMSEQTSFTRFLGLVCVRKAQSLLLGRRIDEAAYYLDKAEKISSAYPEDHNLVYHNKITRAYLLSNQGDLADSFELFFSLIEDLEQQYEADRSMITQIRLANAYGSLALEMANVEITDEAITWLYKALEISTEINDTSQIVRHLNNLNVAYDRKGEYETAQQYLLRARPLAQEISNNSSILRIDYNIGTGYLNLGQPELAKEYFLNGLTLSEEIDFKPGLLHHTYGLASTYTALENFEKARAMVIRSEELAQQINNRPILSHSYRTRYAIEKATGNFETALVYHERFKELDDEYKEFARNQALDELMVQHRVETTRAENEFLANQLILEEQANRQKNLFIVMLSLLFIITVGFAYYFFKVKRELQTAYGVLDVQNSHIARKNEKLEQLSQQRNAFLHVIIHDLRNPLSTIDGASQILQLNENKDTPNELRELTDIIASASKRMNLLIGSLLNIFEKDNKSIETELTNLNTRELVEKVVAEFKPLAIQKHITIRTELDDQNLTAHKDSLIGILSNLISNAIKYSPSNSMVSVISRVMENNWEIIIRDQGPGFSADDLENIFKPFSRLSATPTGDETSTGVGLYSVKTSVLRMNGEIFVNQDYKEGAEFVCRIPVEVGAKELQTTEDSSAF